MHKARTTIRQRLDLAHSVLSAEEDLTYRDALMLHHQSVGIVKHLSKVARRRPGRMRGAATMLTGLTLLYKAENWAKGMHGIDIGGPRSGVSVHFLRYAADRLSAGGWPGVLRVLIDGALERWRRDNPGVVPEPCVGDPMAGQTV